MTIGEPVLRSIIPAETGWSVVFPDEGGKLFRMPIIAWHCEVYVVRDDENRTFVTTNALTCNGDVENFGLYALQFGTEPPFITYNEIFDDEASLLAHFRSAETKRARGAAA